MERLRRVVVVPLALASLAGLTAFSVHTLVDDSGTFLIEGLCEHPARAKSDAQNALRLDLLEPLLRRLQAIDAIAKQAGVSVRG